MNPLERAVTRLELATVLPFGLGGTTALVVEEGLPELAFSQEEAHLGVLEKYLVWERGLWAKNGNEAAVVAPKFVVIHVTADEMANRTGGESPSSYAVEAAGGGVIVHVQAADPESNNWSKRLDLELVRAIIYKSVMAQGNPTSIYNQFLSGYEPTTGESLFVYE